MKIQGRNLATKSITDCSFLMSSKIIQISETEKKIPIKWYSFVNIQPLDGDLGVNCFV